MADEVVPLRRPWWRRTRSWLLIVVVGVVAWLVASLLELAMHARNAEAAISAFPSQIVAGDTAQAAASIEDARSNASALQEGLSSWPIAMLRVVPYLRTNIAGAESVSAAALATLDAAKIANDLYPMYAGTKGAGQKLLRDGSINIAVIERSTPAILQASADLRRAEADLQAVPSDVAPALRGLRNRAAAQITPASRGLRAAEEVLPELPTLLGQGKSATYLVVFNNPAELFPGGGAALNVALLRFDDGRMSVVDRGDIAHFFPQVSRVPWNPVAAGPYFSEKGARDGFAWSNLHQDFRVSGEDLLRSWKANGGAPVDGVIALDPAALEAAIDATGPLESPFYGRITAHNLIRKLLYEGYSGDGASQTRRHEDNQLLIDAMLARMLKSDTALTMGRAMLATAQDQDIRIRLTSGRLSQALHEAGLDGAQPDSQPDRVAFFTQNQNSSKIDVFQRRTVLQDVRLHVDGSAEVTQRVKVANEAPARGGSPLSVRTGYTTRWAFHWDVVLLPQGAQDVRIRAKGGEVRRDRRVFTDVDGRQAVRVGTWTGPGATSRITTTYRLPPGTFGSDGKLMYRVGVEHQLVINDVETTLRVSGPSSPIPIEGEWKIEGDSASVSFAVRRPAILALDFP